MLRAPSFRRGSEPLGTGGAGTLEICPAAAVVEPWAPGGEAADPVLPGNDLESEMKKATAVSAPSLA